MSKNQYGLDHDYFERKIAILHRDGLRNWRSDELARELARMSRTADKSVILEPEFETQVELAALREELASAKHDIASFLETMAKVCDLLGINTEDAKHAEGNPSDVFFSHATAMQQRLTAAEQRNSQMILVPRHLLMRASHSICRGNDLKELRTFLAGVPKECNTCDDRKLVCLDFEMGEWLDCPSCSKPTESGASE